MNSRGSSYGAEAFSLGLGWRVSKSGPNGSLSLPHIVVVLLALAAFCAAPAFAGEKACCDLLTGTCFDDDPAINDKVCTDTDLGGATTCYEDCNCPLPGDCASCMSKQAGNLAEFEFQLVDGSGFFDGTNTTFTYQVCGLGGAALSHFIMDLDPECCLGIVSTSGGSSTDSCQVDGSTGFSGLKFDTTSAPPSCSGLCGGIGDLYSVTLAGNVPTTACLKILNKADGFEDTSTGCILGPDCTDCVPDCDGRNCDNDGCGGSCGTCGGCEDCVDGVCVDSQANCIGCEACVAGVCVDSQAKCPGCQDCQLGICVDDQSKCPGCQDCVDGVCVDSQAKCPGCQDCVDGVCVDSQAKCAGCQDCVDGVCVDSQAKCAGCQDC
ncbi:MAG: hypothetical protein IID35_11700, partial [Planctomycetes bacterium]|nr:hypothetical protein [Planctomycetota bacterium]